MSRSYKRNPVYQDQNTKKIGKKHANRAVRRSSQSNMEIASGGSYKKMYDSWEISDYCFRTTWKDYLSHYQYDKEDGLYYRRGWHSRMGVGHTLNELYNEWASVFLRK